MKQNNCKTCSHFFLADEKAQQGICKRNPPTPFPVQTVDALQQPVMQVINVPVQVALDDWCGEHTTGIKLVD